MKIFQILNNFCHWDATRLHPTIESTAGKYAPDIVFVAAPDYVFEGWGYVDGEFIKPTPPEGWLYDDATGTFCPEGELPPTQTLTYDDLAERLAATEEALRGLGEEI